MKFGKLPDISLVDFQLPADAAGTERLLNALPERTKAAEVYVGCTGWSMKEWVGRVYPKGTKSKDYLRQYGRQFNTIELNTTHYRIPDSATIEKWKAESSPDFSFCPKIPQRISHSNDLGYSNQLQDQFCESIKGLEEKLGCCFMQLPPYFGQDRFGILEQFAKRWPKDIALAIELRHESWFANPNAFKAVFELLESQGLSTVITDVAGRRDVLHQRLTSDTAMIRFVGNGLDPTDYERVDAWVQRLKGWLASGLRRLYFFPHEPDNLLAPEMAAYVVEQLNQHCGLEVRGPSLGENRAGEQISLF